MVDDLLFDWEADAPLCDTVIVTETEGFPDFDCVGGGVVVRDGVGPDGVKLTTSDFELLAVASFDNECETVSVSDDVPDGTRLTDPLCAADGVRLPVVESERVVEGDALLDGDSDVVTDADRLCDGESVFDSDNDPVTDGDGLRDLVTDRVTVRGSVNVGVRVGGGVMDIVDVGILVFERLCEVLKLKVTLDVRDNESVRDPEAGEGVSESDSDCDVVGDWDVDSDAV